MNSLYGNFRTRTFNEIFENSTKFLESIRNSEINVDCADETLITAYYLLYSRYGNSHIANSDENQFKYKVYTILYAYAPTFEKRQEIQSKLRHLSEAELREKFKTINNHSANPYTAPSTDTTDELLTIDSQTTQKGRKGATDSYLELMMLLKDDITETFINRFKYLFLTIVEPELPLWYSEPNGGIYGN